MIETVSILLVIFEPVYRIVGNMAWHKKLGLGIGPDGRGVIFTRDKTRSTISIRENVVWEIR